MDLNLKYKDVSTKFGTIKVRTTVYTQYDKAVDKVASKGGEVPWQVEHLITYVQLFMKLKFNVKVRFVSNLGTYRAGTGKIGSFSLTVDGINPDTYELVQDSTIRILVGPRTGYDIIPMHENCASIKTIEDFDEYLYATIRNRGTPNEKE